MLPPEPDKPNALLGKLREQGHIAPPAADASALDVLHQQIVDFFTFGPHLASVKFWALQHTVGNRDFTIDQQYYPSPNLDKDVDALMPWNSCKMAATLILIFASPNDTKATFEALKFQTRSVGGIITLGMINSTPSADLSKAFAKAKKAAIDGKVGKVTILGVNLVDVEMIERSEKGSRDMHYSSFAHSFVLGISRAGWRIYQPWGEHGYRLDQWLDRDGAKIRDWKGGEDLLEDLRSSCNWGKYFDKPTQRTQRTDINTQHRIHGRRRSTIRTKHASTSTFPRSAVSRGLKSP